MSTRSINEVEQVNHKDIKPKYSGEELLNKLASAVNYSREYGSGPQSLPIEMMYSILIELKSNR